MHEMHEIRRVSELKEPTISPFTSLTCRLVSCTRSGGDILCKNRDVVHIIKVNKLVHYNSHQSCHQVRSDHFFQTWSHGEQRKGQY